MTVPVVVVFFNRPNPLKRLVARLAEIRPPKVYLISDGARDGNTLETEKVAECRSLMQNLPWPCDIRSNFASCNMGCRMRVTSGLDWVFGQESRAIILEDDCIPELEFFSWAEKMLERYNDNPRILSISGTNLRPQLCNQKIDADFTKYAMVWGWATWRRAWQLNDKNLGLFQEACARHWFKKWLGTWRAEWYWRYLLTHIKSSWGYRWAFTHFTQEAYCVIPPVNLIENIGMTDSCATHTSANPYELSPITRGWQGASVAHGISSNKRLDQWIEDNIFSRSLLQRAKWLLRKLKRL